MPRFHESMAQMKLKDPIQIRFKAGYFDALAQTGTRNTHRFNGIGLLGLGSEPSVWRQRDSGGTSAWIGCGSRSRPKTRELGGIDSTIQALPPITEPEPITVFPPRILAPE